MQLHVVIVVRPTALPKSNLHFTCIHAHDSKCVYLMHLEHTDNSINNRGVPSMIPDQLKRDLIALGLSSRCPGLNWLTFDFGQMIRIHREWLHGSRYSILYESCVSTGRKGGQVQAISYDCRFNKYIYTWIWRIYWVVSYLQTVWLLSVDAKVSLPS